MSRTARSRLIAWLAWLMAMGGAGAAAAATEAELQSAVFRAKPAVVMVGVRIGSHRHPPLQRGAIVTVRPAPIGEMGSGAIIHPDGWIVTNGHVVQPFQDGNDSAFAAELLEKAVATACAAEVDALPARADRAHPRARREPIIERTRARALPPGQLSNGKGYPAEIQFYSPPAYVVTAGGRGARPRRRHPEDRGPSCPWCGSRRSTDLHLGRRCSSSAFRAWWPPTSY